MNPSEVFEPAVPLKRPEIKLAEGIAAALSKQADGEPGKHVYIVLLLQTVDAELCLFCLHYHK